MDTGIFIRMTRTLGGFSREVFLLSENLATSEIKREVAAYLNDPSDTSIHGDLHIKEEKCNIWKPFKPLKDKVHVLLVETWSGSGISWCFACRNEKEIKEALRHAINYQLFDKLNAKIYRYVPVLSVTTAEKQKTVNRLMALKRELT
jgi:hypothetical protein